MTVSHELDATANVEAVKEKFGQAESDLNIQQRNLLQALSQPEHDGQLEYTKALLVSNFIVPKSINKREFASDSYIVRQAADLNHAFYDLLAKRNQLKSAGLSYKLEEMKAKRPAELLDERVLAQYNLLARKEWEDRLLDELVTAKRVSAFEKKRQEHKKNVIESDFPQLDTEEVAEDWLTAHQDAVDLIRKYGDKKDGQTEPHIVDQVNHSNLQARNTPQFESQFRSNLNPLPSSNPQEATAAKPSERNSQARPPANRAELSQQAVGPISSATTFEKPTAPPQEKKSNFIGSAKEQDYATMSPQNMHPRAHQRENIIPVLTEKEIRQENQIQPQSQKNLEGGINNVGRPPADLPAKVQPVVGSLEERTSEYAESEHAADPRDQKGKPGLVGPPLIIASKAEVNEVLGDSFPADDFHDDISKYADEDEAMYMPNSMLRPIGASNVAGSQVGTVSGLMGSIPQLSPPKTVELDQKDLEEFNDLDDFDF